LGRFEYSGFGCVELRKGVGVGNHKAGL
jgi:hypothetical protein